MKTFVMAAGALFSAWAFMPEVAFAQDCRGCARLPSISACRSCAARDGYSPDQTAIWCGRNQPQCYVPKGAGKKKPKEPYGFK